MRGLTSGSRSSPEQKEPVLLGSFNAVESDASERVGEPTGAVVTRLRETTLRYEGSNVTVLAPRGVDVAGGQLAAE